MQQQKSLRSATHSNSWYDGDEQRLATQLAGWLNIAQNTPGEGGQVQAIIAPHAGYRYSGSTAAFAYAQPDYQQKKRVFILGPCHVAYMRTCGVSKFSKLETPFGQLNVDRTVVEDLVKTGKFDYLPSNVDEDEHSIELHLPYLAFCLKQHSLLDCVSVVPIVVGAIDLELERQYAGVLKEYFLQPENLFIISTDFCHWGTRFNYRPSNPTGPIWKSIEALDHQGIAIIEEGNLGKFNAYLQETSNTICGRHAVSVLLAIMEKLPLGAVSSKCLHYRQSERVMNRGQSSVSYASLVVRRND